ncbi:putative gustatory receptor 94a [Drosophila innubila]|uniref:putative gustatory receptor 94a n=1 Tax=Drosophila innubila TaxID=198719 RepID=UPI00148B50E3|nr:putative gustatory receptor 94a [Drosophila innubila]
MVLFGIRFSRKPIRGTAKLVHVLLVTLIFMLTLFGLFANRFTLRGRSRFIFSKKYLAYALLVTTIFTSIYVRQMYLDYMTDQLNLRDAVKLYSYMNITVAIINFITQMLMSTTVARMMSNVPLFETLNSIHIDSRTIMTSVLMALIKVLGFPIVLEVALILQQKRNEPHLNWTWTLYNLFPMVISNFLNNCYFGAMIIAKNILEALNAKLKLQVQQVNLMQHEDNKKEYSKYYRTQRFCTLADELDDLSAKYKLICSQSTDYMGLMSLSIVLSLICHLLGITVGFYNQYYAIAEYVIGKKSYDAFGAFINLIFLIISILELALLTYLSNDVLVETRLTGIILQDMNVHEADWRYQQSVHTFTLQVVVIKYRIKPMGLFEIDISLINSMLSAIASFSLILVQSDLSQRFKQ